jgi:Aspartyl protease
LQHEGGKQVIKLCASSIFQFAIFHFARRFLRLAALLAVLTTLEASLLAQKVLTTVPLELRRNHAFVQVTVNAKGPFSFMVDTGTGAEAAVCPDLVEKLGLPVSGEAQLGAPGQQPMKVPVYLISSLKIGDVEFKDVKAAQHRPFPGEEDCAGTLGFALFSNYLFTLDFPRQQLILSSGSLKANDNGTIPFTIPHGAPAITLKVGTRQIDADIDSGGMGLSLPQSFAKDLEFASPPIPLGRVRAGTGSSDFETKGAKLSADVQIAGYTFAQPFIEINPVFPVANFGSIPLRNFAVTFDQQNKLVRFASDQQTLTIEPPRMMIQPVPAGEPKSPPPQPQR